MIVSTIATNLLVLLGYPKFESELIGDSPVGMMQCRLPGSTLCQIHFPTAVDSNKNKSRKTVPYFRKEAVNGLADYTKSNPSLLQFLSRRRHPTPASPAKGSFPLVIFSHGLGGCMEMYTKLTRQIASCGYCVVALEHQDGSGCYATDHSHTPIFYKRPHDDTPYSRQKVVNFRRPFLNHRVQELQALLQVLEKEDGDNENDPELGHVLRAVDTSRVHLVGHSFGGASMVQFAQSLQQPQERNRVASIQSLCLLDCWAFALPDEALDKGVSLPTLSILSQAWLTNPERAQIQHLLQNSKSHSSWYAPHSVHASFADSVSWMPAVATRRLGLRGAQEGRHDTIQTSATAIVQFLENGSVTTTELQPFPMTTTTTHTATKIAPL